MKRKTKHKTKNKKVSVEGSWDLINPHAAGVDIGSREHWACVPEKATPNNVRKFGTYTADLTAMAEWFKQCGVTSVAMEATGVYWIPLFQILESRGLEVILANPRTIKNIAGRKTDVQDCQWIQRLHTYGFLQGSFRPADPYCVLRTYLRYRDELVGARTTQCQHIQKALQQMNVQLVQVLSDVNGVSGMAIIDALIKGERDPVKLSSLVNVRVHATADEIQKALRGDYRAEHMFVLKLAYDLYHTYEQKITTCDEQIVQETAKLPDKVDAKLKPIPERKIGRQPCRDKMAGQDMRQRLYEKFGVDLTAVEGIGTLTGLVLLTEGGPNVGRFRTEKHFASWLGLCPDNRISGGKILSSRTRRVVNRATDALRIAASTLKSSKSALGAFFRRMKARLGAAEAITAVAHKLARITYRMIKHGEAYVRQGLEAYEIAYKTKQKNNLQKFASSLGYKLVPCQTIATPVS